MFASFTKGKKKIPSLLNQQDLFCWYFWRVGSKQLANEKWRHTEKFTEYHTAIKDYLTGCRKVDPGSRLILFGL